MNRIFVEPLDVLLFRSERPFTARETHMAKMGAISPSVFEGAIKSKIFYDFCKEKEFSPAEFQRIRNEGENAFRKRVDEKLSENNDLREILEFIGHPTVSKRNQIIVRGVFFAREGEYQEHFPIPNDIVRKDEEIVKLEPKENIRGNVSYGSPVSIALSKYFHIENVDGLMIFDELVKYLKGCIPEVQKVEHIGKKLSKPYFKETRTGIELEKGKKRTLEEALYVAEFLRVIEKWGFTVWYEAPNNILSEKGIIKLGGEGKGAVYNKIDEKTFDFSSQLIDEINREKKFKLYLPTPSLFNGWKPPVEEIKKVFGVDRLMIISALPGKSIYIGGYDFALNKEKPLRRWVNAGAIYYFRFEGKIRRDLPIPIKILNDSNIEMRCGFIGRW
ncbi:MAG: type III-B CRISPR module-associated protein Cmr3 [Candidatus Bathyarchaeota archaeon]|jgi:CRISPR-associated protein Cmr3|nr:type III-B CRISPR module-associated protein Cmr3 [Candidatus Bathyarchaeota archaeon]